MGEDENGIAICVCLGHAKSDFCKSVRVRVGFRVLNRIKKIVDDIFLYNSEVPGFRKNVTIL